MLSFRQGYFITAPDVVRVGVSETVLVSLRNTGGSAIPIKLLLQSFPSKDVTYAEEIVHVEASEYYKYILPQGNDATKDTVAVPLDAMVVSARVKRGQ